MNRCIHCTRCVRFMTEVAGVDELGAIGRGEDMEITTYLDRGILSELSANVNDLCPVGALTHRPWSYIARPWELEKTESFDVMDAVGSAIRVDTRGREVMRVLPRINDDVNEEWISDKTRFACDGLRMQRLDHPYVRKVGKLPRRAGRGAALVAEKLKAAKPARVGAIAGDLAAAEEMFALKVLLTRSTSRASIAVRTGPSSIPRRAARATCSTPPSPVSTRRTRSCSSAPTRAWRRPCSTGASTSAGARAASRSGSSASRLPLTYPYEYLGAGPQTLADLSEGQHSFAKVLKEAKRPMVIVGAGAAARADGAAVLGLSARIALAAMEGKEERRAGTRSTCCTRRPRALPGSISASCPDKGALDAPDLVAAAGKDKLDVLFLLGADEIELPETGSTFIVYQGSHGDRGAHRAEVICRAPPIPKKARPTSTPKDARR